MRGYTAAFKVIAKAEEVGNWETMKLLNICLTVVSVKLNLKLYQPTSQMLDCSKRK